MRSLSSAWTAGLLVAAMSLPGCLSFHRGALPGEPEDATFAEVAGARIRYTDVGSGPAVVMLHGFASSLDTWKDLTADLSRDHRVIALDFKGFGWSDRPPGDYSPDAQAALVLALLDQLGVTKAAWVAHSWGSAVALVAAHANPERVERLVLIGAWAYAAQEPSFFGWAKLSGAGEALMGLYYDQRVADRMEMAFYDPELVTLAYEEKVQAQLERPGTRAAALAAIRGANLEELEKRWPSVEQPTLLLWGREDRVARLRFGEQMSRELPNSELIVLPRCGHFPMREAAARTQREIRRFLTTPLPVRAQAKP